MVPMPIGLIVQHLLIAGRGNLTAGADIAQHNHGAAGAKRAGACHFQSPETLAEGDLRLVINDLARQHQHGETVQGIAQLGKLLPVARIKTAVHHAFGWLITR